MNVFLFLTLLALTAGYALWKGDRDARIAAMICVLATALTHVLISPLSYRYHAVEVSTMIVDLATLAAFVALALTSSRFWPLWVAGLQLTASTAHVLKALNTDLLPLAYAVAERFWVYPILLLVAAGAYRGHRRAMLGDSHRGLAA